MADNTIGGLTAVPVGDLPLAPDVYDDTLIPVEQQGEAWHMSGAQWKGYAIAAAAKEADRAEQAIVHQPIIRDRVWYIWDATLGDYVSSGVLAEVDPDYIRVGGRNLIAKTDNTTVHSGAKGSGSYADVWDAKTINIPTGTEYIVSFDAMADADQDITCFFHSPNTTTSAESSTGQTGGGVDGAVKVSITTEWKRYWVKWTQTPADTVKSIIVGRNYKETNVYIRAVKLEEGNVTSAWTPAPEDVEAKYLPLSGGTMTGELAIKQGGVGIQLGTSGNICATDVYSGGGKTRTVLGIGLNWATDPDTTDETTVGHPAFHLALRGSAERPTYCAGASKANNIELALLADIPSTTETWTFTLEDGSTVTREVYIK